MRRPSPCIVASATGLSSGSAGSAPNAQSLAPPPVGLGPADLQSAYALPSSTGGTGATVAIVDAFDDPSAEADLGTYRSTVGLPACTTANGCFQLVNQNGQPTGLSLHWNGQAHGGGAWGGGGTR